MVPTQKQIMSNAVSEDKFLASMRRNHKARMVRTIKGLEDKMIRLMKDIEVDKSGKVLGAKVNLKQAQAIHKQMLNLFTVEYGEEVKGLIDDFDSIARHIQRSWRSLGEAVEFTGVDRDMIRALKSQTYGEYEAFGTAAQTRIANAMYGAVTGATNYSDLLKTVQGALTGHEDIRGRSMLNYADQHTFDSVMNFQNQVNVKKAEDLGFDHFLYVGDVISTSRQFCISRAGKVYSKEQIESWNGMSWKGRSGPPMTHRGGYNCRHHWRAVRPEWFEGEELDIGNYFEESEEALFVKIKPTDSPEIVSIKQEINKETALKSGFRKRRIAIQNEMKKVKAGSMGGEAKDKLKSLQAEFKALQTESAVLRKRMAELKGRLEGSVTETTLPKKPVVPKPPVTPRPMPKPVPKKVVMPPEETPIWRPIKEVDGMALQKMHVNSFQSSGFEAKKAVDWENFFGEKLEDLYRRHPMITDIAKKHPLSRLFIRNEIRLVLAGTGEQAKTIGFFSPSRKRIELALRGKWKTDRLKMGGWSTGGEADVGSLFRHEFGHHIYEGIELRDEMTWVQLFKGQGRGYWSKKVSLYGSGEPRELFAEAFSAYTSPLYGTTAKRRLPKEIEDFMERVFGKPIIASKKAEIIKDLFKKRGVKVPDVPSGWEASVRDRHMMFAKELRDRTPTYKGLSLDQMVDKINNHIKKIVDGSDVYINVHTVNLKQILNDGRFKSQFETNSSGGLLSPKKRKTFEKNVMGYSHDWPAANRPIYGSLSSTKAGPPGVYQYGDVRIKLKDSVRDRTTFTIGDSLNYTDAGRVAVIQPSPLNKPSWLSGNIHGSFDPLKMYKSTTGTSDRYWEAQIHGGVTVGDIDIIYFKGPMPGEDTIQLLDELHIPWERI